MDGRNASSRDCSKSSEKPALLDGRIDHMDLANDLRQAAESQNIV